MLEQRVPNNRTEIGCVSSSPLLRAISTSTSRAHPSCLLSSIFYSVTGNTGALVVSDRSKIMDRLNEGFAKTAFQFVYAGSTQTANGVHGAVSGCTQTNQEKFQKFIRKGGPTTLNIFVCDTTLGGKTENLGYATTPPSVIIGDLGIDGIGIVHPDAIGWSLVDTTESAIHGMSLRFIYC